MASQEIVFDDELRKAATVSFKDTGGNDRQSPFFLCLGGKAQAPVMRRAATMYGQSCMVVGRGGVGPVRFRGASLCLGT